MRGQTVILRGPEQRRLACEIVMAAPTDGVVNVRGPGRNASQNDRMWAMLSDVSRAKPEGWRWPPETWKAAFMHALGHQIRFAEGLDDSGPFPIGYRSSHLTVRQMSDLITTIMEYGDRHGVRWSDPRMIEMEAAR